MKNKTNFAFGFTIAELLVTMLITMVVAAAMVPVIGLKKVKFPRNIVNHGVAECYYRPVGEPDANGDYSNWQLMYFYVDNTQKGTPQPVAVNGQYCTFEAPNSDFIEITAIGPGTDAYSMVPNVFALKPGNASIKGGKIRVDQNYQNDIASATAVMDGQTVSVSDKIYQVLNAWAKSYRANELYAEYLFDSPVGAGGRGNCEIQFIEGYESRSACHCGNNAVGSECKGPVPGYWTEATMYSILSQAPADYCWYYLHAQGTDSGRGRKSTIPLRIKLSDTVDILETVADEYMTSFEYQDQQSQNRGGVPASPVMRAGLKLQAAPAGKFPVYEFLSHSFRYPEESEDAPECEGGLCSQAGVVLDNTMVNKKSLKGDEGAIEDTALSCVLGDGEPADPGKIYYGSSRSASGADDPAKLEWSYNAILASPTVGTGGSMGEENSVVYESLKGKLYLRPAPYQAGSISGVTYVRENVNDARTTLVSARAKGPSGSRQAISFPIVTSDMPIPKKSLEMAKPSNDFNYVPKLMATKFNGGLRECAVNPNKVWCPGYAGHGQYFYITDVPNLNSFSLTNLYNNKTFSVPTEQIFEENSIDDSNPLCKDGVTRPVSMGQHSYPNPSGGNSYFTPKYCQEKKQKGSPGAVIVIW